MTRDHHRTHGRRQMRPISFIIISSSGLGSFPVHYGWIIVIACLIIGVAGYSTYFCFTLFYSHLVAELVWSRSVVSGAKSLGLVTYLRLADGLVRQPVRSAAHCGCLRMPVRPWHCPWRLHYRGLAVLRPLPRLVRDRHGCGMITARCHGFALVRCLTSRHSNRYRRPRQRVRNLFHRAAR